MNVLRVKRLNKEYENMIFPKKVIQNFLKGEILN